MEKMSSSEVRQTFLDFFEAKGHRAVASSSLVPADDPTLLFVNAGMVQFKDVFLGLDKRNYQRAATSQKCMRVSGKHNDLENVGPSLRHHTFFEMLGNFSFGDYFKRDAIKYAFELLTEVYKLPPDRLAVTIYENDDESYDCWVNEVGISKKRIARMGPSTNFWQMADTGPCGPNTEIHWDKFPEQGDEDVIALLGAEDDRFLEIWNLVFMQFNRQQADPEHSGQWDVPLPAPGVDTGMGFERILTILQGVEANYETDLFTPIIERTQELTGHSDAERDANIVPYRVIADHIRAAVFLISDGVMPGAKGRSAIPRIVIRRAARFGREIGFDGPFLAHIADSVIDIMGEHYAELVENAESIKRSITLEEERFHRTMDRGLIELESLFTRIPYLTEGLEQQLVDRLPKELMKVGSSTDREVLPSISSYSAIHSTVDKALRELSRISDISITINRALSELSTMPDIRDTLDRALGESSDFSDVSKAIDKALLASSAIPDVHKAIDKALLASSAIPDIHKAIDKALLASSAIPDFRKAMDKALLESSAVPDVRKTVARVLHESRATISPLLLQWREEFGRNVSQDLARAYDAKQLSITQEAISETLAKASKTLYGGQAFHLKATLGLPFQLTKDVVEERGYTIDEAGFAEAEAEHARISGGGAALGEIETGEFYRELLADLQSSGQLPASGLTYQPYTDSPAEGALLALAQDGILVDIAIVGDKVELVLSATHFYVEAGGQVSDTGTISGDGWMVEVEAMKQPVAGLVVHIGEVVEGVPAIGDKARAQVDRARRKDITRNHTATHLLHAALRNQLGAHVQQRGSLVAPDRLRFDFSHSNKIQPGKLEDIEKAVNDAILAGYSVRDEMKSLGQARQEGAIALFGEKYGDTVRTVNIGSEQESFSYELCGGIHVTTTSEVGSFVFVSEGSIGAGIRRVEAVTGREANEENRRRWREIHNACLALGTNLQPRHVTTSNQQLHDLILQDQDRFIQLSRLVEDMQRREAKNLFEEIVERELEMIAGVHTLIVEVNDITVGMMREMSDLFRNRVSHGIMVLASNINNQAKLVVAVSDEIVKAGLRAGDIIKPIAKIVGGGGGGRPQMAQAGGVDSSKIPDALETAREVIEEASEDIA